MTTRSSGAIAATAAFALAVTGCAGARAAPLADVERLVTTRTRHAVRWTTAPDDPRARSAIEALLADDLTVEGAVRIALLNSPSLRATFERLGIAEADVIQAGLLPNPVVHAGLRLPVNTVGPSAELSLVQDFLHAMQIPLRRRVAESGLAAAKLDVGDAVLELVAAVKTGFYGLQGTQQMRALQVSVVDATEYGADFTRRQHEAGNITELDLVSELAAFEQARLDLAESEADVLTAREELATLLGLWGKDLRWTVSARLPDVPLEELPRDGLETRAVSQRLDLAAAHETITQLAQSLRLTQLQGLIPTGDLGVDAEREPDGGWGVGPAIELPLPIFDWGKAARANALAQLRQERERYRALAVEVRSGVRRARTRAELARRRALHYQQVILPLRQRVVEQTQLQYNAMQVGIAPLLLARREEIDAGRRYLETLTEFWTSIAALERAVGGTLPGSNDAPGTTAAGAPEAKDGTRPRPTVAPEADGGTPAGDPGHHQHRGD